MSSLSVPKKLLKGKNKGENKLSAAAYVLTEHYNFHAVLLTITLFKQVRNPRNLRCHIHFRLHSSPSTPRTSNIRSVYSNLTTKNVSPRFRPLLPHQQSFPIRQQLPQTKVLQPIPNPWSCYRMTHLFPCVSKSGLWVRSPEALRVERQRRRRKRRILWHWLATFLMPYR
jgi:hypothetical protein